MSQKKLKRLRKSESLKETKEITTPILGIRGIIKKHWKFLLILCLGVTAIYFNSLNGYFVSDDYASITQNPEIKSLSTSLKSTGAATTASNSLLSIFFGIENPIPFHVFNLSLYLMILVAAFVFIFLLTGSKLVSEITLIIFAVLPVHVEAVTWISGRPYLFVALLVLTGMSSLILLLKTKRNKYLWFILIILALLFKTDRIRGFSLVILGIVYLVTFKEKLGRKVDLGKILGVAGILTCVLAAIFWPLIRERISSVNSGVNVSESIFYNPFFQYPTAMSKYLQLIVFPVDLTLYHTMFPIPVWLNWLIVLTYLTAVVWFYFKNKNFFFALVFIFAATAPSMAPVKVSWLVAERYVFLGSLGAALLVGLLVEQYWERKKIIIPILILVTAGYSARVILRNVDWQTNHNLWVNTCQVSPNSHNAWNNIGDDYDKLAQQETTDEGKQRQYENAVKGFGMSFAIKPNYADAYHNQANIFYKMGRIDLARQTYEAALSYNPALSQTYLTLVQLDLLQNDRDNLVKHLSNLNQVRPNDLEVAYLTASAYARIGMIEEAKQLAKLMYQQVPNIPEIKALYDSLFSQEASPSGTIK